MITQAHLNDPSGRWSLLHCWSVFCFLLLLWWDIPCPFIRKPYFPKQQQQSLQILLLVFLNLTYSSVQFSGLVVSDSLGPHGMQHVRLPCPSSTPGVYSNWCPLSWWCHPTISSSVVPFSSLLQSFPASGPFPISQFFTSGGQSIGVSASTSVLPMKIQDWSPLGRTGWISL